MDYTGEHYNFERAGGTQARNPVSSGRSFVLNAELETIYCW
jgi:hypothetical protein